MEIVKILGKKVLIMSKEKMQDFKSLDKLNEKGMLNSNTTHYKEYWQLKNEIGLLLEEI